MDEENGGDGAEPSKGRAFIPDFIGAVKDVATNSVISPLQWILGIVAAFCALVAIFSPDPLLRVGAFLLMAAAVGYVLFAFDHFRRKSPNRLQSERFIHAQTKLRQEEKLLLDERNRGNMRVLDAQPVANTHPTVYSTESTPSGEGGVE